MIKRLSFLVRKDGMSSEEFRLYWLNHHASILKKMPNVLHYSITCFVEGAERIFVEQSESAPDGVSIDGFASLSFASEEDMLEAYASPAEVAASADIPNFAKIVARIVVDETTIINRKDNGDEQADGQVRYSVSFFDGSVSGVLEVVVAFCGWIPMTGAPTCSVLDVTFLREAHSMLDPCEGLFDRIEVWRVGRQVPEPCARGPDHATELSRLVAAEIDGVDAP
jgi:uncharacterized protein (TIGR02118 family)